MRGRITPSAINRKKIISNVSVKDIVNVNTNNKITTRRVGVRSTPITIPTPVQQTVRTTPVQQTVRTTTVQQTTTPKTIVTQRTIGARNTPRTISQTQSKPIVIASGAKLTTAGIVIAPHGAAEKASGNKPVSTNLFGEEIKYKNNRMDLSIIANRNPLEAGLTGVYVPTEQMVGIGKDVIYGVSAEDQKQVESGLDLLFNPIFKPFADPVMKEEGIIKDEWYWPEELKSDWKVLPAFMQKSERKEKQSFIEGVSSNIGNISAIIQSDQAAKIRDAEFAISAERFNTSPSTQAYYIGSALGEIPYFLIGVGEVKLAGTIAAKAVAGTLRGGVKGTTGIKAVLSAIKVEKASNNLSKAVKTAGDTKLININAITDAKKKLTDGLSISIDTLKKNMFRLDTEDTILAGKKIEDGKRIGKELKNMFGKKQYDMINNMKEGTDKQVKIKAFNEKVKDKLLPETKKFKNAYLAETFKHASNSKIEWLASRIEGSPGDITTKIDKMLNKPETVTGDLSTRGADVITHDIWRNRILDNERAGKYTGVFGKELLNIDLYSNVIQSAVGISKKQKDIKYLAELLSRNVPETKVFDKEGKESMLKILDQNINERKTTNKNLYETLQFISKIDEQKITQKQKTTNETKIKELETQIKNNEIEIKELEKTKKEGFHDSYFMNQSYSKKRGTTQWSFDYPVIREKFPDIAEALDEETLNVGIRPTVGIRREGGITSGTIGDGPDRFDFFETLIPRSEAITTYGIDNVSDLSKIPRPEFITVGFGHKKRIKTPLVKTKEPTESIIAIYQPSDNARPGGTLHGFVKPLVIVSKDTTDTDINQMMKDAYLEYFSGSKDVEKKLGGGKDGKFKVLQYKKFEQEDIDDNIKNLMMDNEEITASKNPLNTFIEVDKSDYKKGSKHTIMDINISRAQIENRPDEVVYLATEKIRMLGAYKDKLKSKYHEDKSTLEKKLKKTDKPKIDELEKKYGDEIGSITSDIEQTKKLLNIDKVKKLIQSKGSHKFMQPGGTLISFTRKTLSDIDKKEQVRNYSNVIQDMKTKKYYFMAPENKVFEIIKIKNFNPDKVSSADNIDQTRVIQSSINGEPYYDQFVTKTKIGMGNKSSKYVVAKLGTEDIGTMMGESKTFINLKVPETYKGKLSELTPDQVKKLFGSAKKLKDFADKNINKIKLDNPRVSFDSATSLHKIDRPMEQLIKEEFEVVVAKQIAEKSTKIYNIGEKLHNTLYGERFRHVEFGSLKPDSSMKYQTESFFGGLTSGTSIRNAGFPNFGKLFNIDLERHLTQEQIPSGVQVHPVYLGMDIHNLPLDRFVKETQVNPLKPRVINNYQMMLNEIKHIEPESISRSPINNNNPDSFALQEFKKRMVNLVRVKGIGGKKLPPLGINELIEVIDPLKNTYKTMVEDIVNRSDNKYIRNQTKRDRITKSSKFITANDMKLNLSFDNNNLITRKIANIKSKIIPMSFNNSKIYKSISTGGIEVPRRGLFNNIATKINEKITGQSVLLEPANPHMTQALREILKDIPPDNLPKKWQKIKDKVGSMGDNAAEESVKNVYKYTKDETDLFNQKINSINSKIKSKEDKLLNIKQFSNETDSEFKKRIYNINEKISNLNKDKDDLNIGFKETYGGNVKPQHYFKTSINNLTNIPFDRSVSGERLNPKPVGDQKDILRWDGMDKNETIKFLKEELYRDMDKGGYITPVTKKTKVFGATPEDKAKVSGGNVPDVKGIDFKVVGDFKGPGVTGLDVKPFKSGEVNPPDTFKETYNPPDPDQFKTEMTSVEKKKQKDLKRFESAEINVREMIRNNSLNINKDKVIGFKKQAVMISPFLTSTINTVKPKQNNQNQLLPYAYAQEQINTQQESTNPIDQFITDIQNTMTGITKGNTRIGDTSIGQDVKTFKPDSSLDIFGGAKVIPDQQQQTINNLGSIVRPKVIYDQKDKTKINEILREKYNIGLKSGEKLKETELNKYQFRPVYRFAQKIIPDIPNKNKPIIPPPVTFIPKIPSIPRIVTPAILPVFNIPSGSNVNRRQNDPPKRKKKKTWWQTPENWYDPYYWGGKNQEGSGYITFTGKEPSKVRKYEKRFFGGI